MDQLLRDFAHAIAPGPTWAVANKENDSLTVYVLSESVKPGTVVVARCDETFVTGRIAHPAPGWVEIDGTAYPASRVEVRGPVLFVATPIPGRDTDAHQRTGRRPTELPSGISAERRPTWNGLTSKD